MINNSPRVEQCYGAQRAGACEPSGSGAGPRRVATPATTSRGDSLGDSIGKRNLQCFLGMLGKVVSNFILKPPPLIIQFNHPISVVVLL